jgi:hypothetical protein
MAPIGYDADVRFSRRRLGSTLLALAATALTPVAGSANAKTKGGPRAGKETPPGIPADVAAVAAIAAIAAIRADLKILTDGKTHYLAVVPFGAGRDLYYGDGKTFYAQRVVSSGSVGKESFNYSFWEPRVNAPYQASFELRDGRYRVQCDERLTELTPLPDAENQAMIESARFFAPRWRTLAHALARDDRGTYYFVDRGREPEDSKTYRLYAGLKGSMKPLKMLNIVSDSQGEIFSTPAGELRLVIDRRETVWIHHNQRTSLINLPVEDNHTLIYTDLGVYAGQRLGTPCDDL